MKLECIDDSGFDIVHQVWINQYPKKGEIYTLRERVHTAAGLGYLL